LINIEFAMQFVNDELSSDNQLPSVFLKELLTRVHEKINIEEEKYERIRKRVLQSVINYPPLDQPYSEP
jgi:hypothetical protein